MLTMDVCLAPLDVRRVHQPRVVAHVYQVIIYLEYVKLVFHLVLHVHLLLLALLVSMVTMLMDLLAHYVQVLVNIVPMQQLAQPV